MHDLSSVTTSKLSMSNIAKDFKPLNPDSVGGLEVCDGFFQVLVLEGFGGGGGGGNIDVGGGT